MDMHVRKFLKVDGVDCPGYVSVSWFGPPQYPRGSNRLEVVVSRGRGSRVVYYPDYTNRPIDGCSRTRWCQLTYDETEWIRHG